MESLLFEYLPSIVSLSGLVMISLISPGPDFAVVVKNSVVYSRKTALLTALGISLGILVHVTYILLGLGFVIAKTPWLLFSIKCLGAATLFSLGFRALKQKKGSSLLGGVPIQNMEFPPLPPLVLVSLPMPLTPNVSWFLLCCFRLL